ncbi:MAG: thermonuclease family protein, partial [Prochloraceae cyanobacterium]
LFLLTFTLISCSQFVERRNNIGDPNADLNSDPAISEVWQVKPGSVYDGDTFRVIKGNKELKIRMCGIDAPEKKQPLGIESRDYLRSLLAKNGDRVSIVITDRDRYGRTVAEIFVSDGDREIFVNGEMVRVGLAYEYKRYSGKCPNKEALDTAGKIAEANKAGVWSDPNAIAPWEYRNNSRKR